MIIDETISYRKLVDDYIRYFDNFNLDNLDTVGEMGIYSGTANDYWINNYEVYGNFTLLFTNSQLLFFTDCNRVFVRHRANSGYWLNWNDISPSTTLATNDSNIFTISTGTKNNISVLELKNINSSLMPSGEISFTLIYKYK